jgi:hypothetical protein
MRTTWHDLAKETMRQNVGEVTVVATGLKSQDKQKAFGELMQNKEWLDKLGGFDYNALGSVVRIVRLYQCQDYYIASYICDGVRRQGRPITSGAFGFDVSWLAGRK